MSKRPSDGIGPRLARFRKLSGLSARELSEAAGMGLSRGVIANIERGKKKEITVDQLIALSSALGIPPVVLALPVDAPYSYVRLQDGESGSNITTAEQAANWFEGVRNMFRINQQISEGDATEIAESIVRGIRQHSGLLWRLRKLRADQSRGANRDGALTETLKELEDLEAGLRRLKVDVRLFHVDDEPRPEGDRGVVDLPGLSVEIPFPTEGS